MTVGGAHYPEPLLARTNGPTYAALRADQGEATMGTTGNAAATALRFIDADGHLLEPPDAMLEYAPSAYKDRVWHIETDAAGEEWVVFDDSRYSANTSAISGTAGMSVEDRA